MMLDVAELDTAVELALSAATVASCLINRVIENRSLSEANAQAKSNSTDLVTAYDKQCEEEVLAILRSGTPDYHVLSEELHSQTVLTDTPTWVVDPIDGTTSFVHGLYDCCVSIALVVNKQPVIGVVSAPRLQEVFSAVKGRGAFCNGQRIHVSSVTSLNKAMAIVHHSYNRSPRAVQSIVAMQAELAQVPVHSLRCNGAAALDMCFVAAGRADLYFEVGIHPWDYAAGAIIVQEAGGVVHDVESTEYFDLSRCGVCCGCSVDITRHGVALASRHAYRSAVLELQ